MIHLSAQTLALITVPIFALWWIGELAYLPVAIYRNDLRWWAREMGYCIYCTVFVAGCLYVRALFP